MKKETYDEIIKEMLSVAPELNVRYAKMIAWYGSIELSEQDAEELNEIRKVHSLDDNPDPGLTIVLEELLVPFFIDQTLSKSKPKTQKIANWIEDLASGNDLETRNLVAVSFCAPLLTNYESSFPRVFPSLGKQTKSLCKLQLSAWKLEQKTRDLFYE